MSREHVFKAASNIINEQITANGPTIISVDPQILVTPDFTEFFLIHGYFITRIDDEPISDKSALMEALQKKCHFPEYFGANWDALNDALLDFSWISARGFILILAQPYSLEISTREMFFEIIIQVAEVWARDKIPFKLLIPQN